MPSRTPTTSKPGTPSVTESDDEFHPATQSDLSQWMTENAARAARPVYPVGGRTALQFGYPVEQAGMTLSTDKLTRIIDYPARDMTITVEAGIRIDDLAATLRNEGQRLAVDVAQSHRATLGGVVATSTSGPRRFGLGTMRDYVIGLTAVDAAGSTYKAGGRVVKNVAGYDLCKMLVGSFGTLAVVTQLTLKLKPIPESTAILWTTFDDWHSVDAALERLTSSAARPVALEVLEPIAAASISTEAGVQLQLGRLTLCIGLEGTAREIQWQIDMLKSELRPLTARDLIAIENEQATKLWHALNEFQIPSEEPVTFKANLRPSRMMAFLDRAVGAGVALQAHAGNGIVVGHLPDSVTTATAARAIVSDLAETAREGGGNLVVVNCDVRWKRDLPLFGTPSPAWPLMQKLKAQLDPRNLLNPQRFVYPL